VVTNQSRNFISRFLRRFDFFAGDKLDLIADTKISITENIERADELIKLSKSLRTLPKIDRDIIFLKFYDEMSYAEIGRITGLMESNVGARLSRALRRLEDELSR
jgi:RNA polymerase sigma-70 factor (ECF subfamily)